MLFGLKMKVKNKIIELYGNRGYKFDFLISIIIVIIIAIFGISFIFVRNIIDNLNESGISFLGIVVGFLLTTFSLLFLYDPKSSEKLSKIRQLPIYKSMLSTFISTAFIIILLTIGLLLINAFITIENSFFYPLALIFIIFAVLRSLKCIFYLYAIIELS